MLQGPGIPHNIDKILASKIKKQGIWQRKTDSEIEKVKRELRKSSLFNMTMPLGIFFAVMLICILFLPKFSHRLIYCIFASLLSLIFTYGYQLYRGRSLALSQPFKICNQCFKEDYIGLKKCACGGTLESAEFYTFIERLTK